MFPLRHSIILSILFVALGLSGCINAPQRSADGVSQAPQKPANPWAKGEGGLALLTGIHYYEQGQYDQARINLQQALAAGFEHKSDRVRANKYLAFIECATNHTDACAAAFRRAFALDPGFALAKAEQGHPMWDPVFQQVKRSIKQK